MPKGKGTYGSKVGRPPKKAAKGEGKKVDKYFAGGGKVESNPYGWPSRDARNGGKK